MAREIIIETDTLGDVFVKKHKKKHHHHHYDGSHGPTWEEYERLREHDAAVSHERDHLRAELEKANATIARQDAEERRLVGENHHLRHDVENLRKASEGWEDTFRGLRNKLTRAQNDNDLLGLRNRKLESQLDQLENKMAKTEQYVNRLLEQVDRLKDDLDRLRHENTHLREKLAYYETAPPHSGRPAGRHRPWW